MSKPCLFQTRHDGINEARCCIPLYFNSGCGRHTCGTWFCKFYKNEDDCPIIKDIVSRYG